MDLAEIRKKAKNAKKGEPLEKMAPGVEASRAQGSIQGAPLPVPSEPEHPIVPAPSLPENDLPEVAVPSLPADGLDDLFAWSPEMELATEEVYQQGLASRDEEEDEDLRRWLAFSLGEEEYALDIEGIQEIIKPRDVTDIPRVPDFILGIISLRGIIIPVFDLKKRLKLGQVDISTSARIVVCRQGDRCAGLLVDRITQVLSMPAGKIEPPPAVLYGLDRALVEGVGRHQGRMMILLNPVSVLDAELT
ncbi:MAG: chemotaxis protein CheW [Desulfuromonas sp.]|nr:MAG: chemotaxis protein CheW [Desulfuromonas sp.]